MYICRYTYIYTYICIIKELKDKETLYITHVYVYV